LTRFGREAARGGALLAEERDVLRLARQLAVQAFHHHRLIRLGVAPREEHLADAADVDGPLQAIRAEPLQATRWYHARK